MQNYISWSAERRGKARDLILDSGVSQTQKFDGLLTLQLVFPLLFELTVDMGLPAEELPLMSEAPIVRESHYSL